MRKKELRARIDREIKEAKREMNQSARIESYTARLLRYQRCVSRAMALENVLEWMEEEDKPITTFRRYGHCLKIVTRYD